MLHKKADIMNINYLKNTFDIHNTDSIKFYGRNVESKRKNRRIPVGTAVLLCSKHPDFYTECFDSLTSISRTMMNKLEDMFKPGGIVFKTANELILYSVNTCGPGYKNL